MIGAAEQAVVKHFFWRLKARQRRVDIPVSGIFQLPKATELAGVIFAA